MSQGPRGNGEPRLEPPDETPPAPSVPTTGAGVPELLLGYEDVVETIRNLPVVVVVPSTHRRRGLLRFVHALPRPRWFLLSFAVRHAETTLDSLRRRLLASSALGHASRADQADREAVEQYLQSLPTRKWKAYPAFLLMTTVLFTRFTLINLPGVTEFLAGSDVSADSDAITRILDRIGRLSSDLSSWSDLLMALSGARAEVTLLLAATLLVTLYIQLRLLLPSFRLKRMLFNLYPDMDRLASTTASWSVPLSTGLYRLERSVFRGLSGRPPHESPFDLVPPALLVPLLLYVGGLVIHAGLVQPVDGDPILSFTLGLAIIIGGAARLAWLLRTWLRRTSNQHGHYMPYEARIRNTSAVVTTHNPLSLLMVTGLAGAFWLGLAFARYGASLEALHATRFFVMPLVIAPVWYRMNRELFEFIRAHEPARAGRPVLSFLAMAFGWFRPTPLLVLSTLWVFASVYGTCRRIKRAEDIAGRTESNLSPISLLVPGFVVFPLVLAHLQAALNSIWRTEAEVLEPA